MIWHKPKGPVTWGNLSLQHVPTTKSHTWHTVWLDTVTCHCNEFLFKMVSQGRPTIGLFTELSQRHVTWACHTRGWNVCVIFCRHYMLHKFKLIWIHVISRCVELHKNIHVTWDDLSKGCVISCDRTLYLHDWLQQVLLKLILITVTSIIEKERIVKF